ncbi:hypothetical protein ACWC0C_14805 [Streptomyces sp. NPDC001709]
MTDGIRDRWRTLPRRARWTVVVYTGGFLEGTCFHLLYLVVTKAPKSVMGSSPTGRSTPAGSSFPQVQLTYQVATSRRCVPCRAP